MHNLFLVHLSSSTCFGRLCAHHQEKQLCLCDTWYLLFCVDDSLVCRSIYLSIYTCFGRLCGHHQDRQLCFYDTWYFNLYMFRSTTRPSSGETIVFMRHVIFQSLHSVWMTVWYSGAYAQHMLLHTRIIGIQEHMLLNTRIISTKCRINSYFS